MNDIVEGQEQEQEQQTGLSEQEQQQQLATGAGAEDNQTGQPGEQQQVDENGKPIEKKAIVFDTDQQGVFDNAMAGKTAKIRDSERANAVLQQELEDARSKIPKSQRPAIPDMPDKEVENFTELMTARDKVVQAAATFDATEVANSQAALAQQQTQQRNAQQALSTAQDAYTDRGVKLGITEQTTTQANKVLQESGMALQLQIHLLEEPTGPQISAYLAKHPAELDTLVGLDPMAAAVKIASEIKGKAATFFKTGNPAPAPSDDLGGGGGNQEDGGGPPGATYS